MVFRCAKSKKTSVKINKITNSRIVVRRNASNASCDTNRKRFLAVMLVCSIVVTLEIHQDF